MKRCAAAALAIALAAAAATTETALAAGAAPESVPAATADTALAAGPAFRESLRLRPSPRPLIRSHEALAFGGLFLSAYLLDDEIRGELRKPDVSDALDPVGDVGRFLDPLGRSKRWRLAGVLTFAAGGIAGDESVARTGLLLFAAATVNEAATAALKLGFGRYRPFVAGRDGDDFHPFDRQNNALPSGHASSAFAAATVLAGRFEPRWIDALAYGAASAVALQRVVDEKHWASDVVLGAATGIFCGRLVLLLDGGRPSEKGEAKRSRTP